MSVPFQTQNGLLQSKKVLLIPPHPKTFPPDQYGNNFPIGALSLPMINGERSVRME